MDEWVVKCFRDVESRWIWVEWWFRRIGRAGKQFSG